jgi:hypothetical protein
MGNVATMERTYAAWTKGAKPEDVVQGCNGPREAAAGTEAIETPLSPPELALGWH